MYVIGLLLIYKLVLKCYNFMCKKIDFGFCFCTLYVAVFCLVMDFSPIRRKKNPCLPFPSSFIFQYRIASFLVLQGKTDSEWSEAVRTACEDRGDHDVMSISAFPLSTDHSSTQEQGKVGTGACTVHVLLNPLPLP